MVTTTAIINTAIPLSSFEEVKNAFHNRDYDGVIRQATNTIAHVQHFELLLLLEHRAHALSMKSKFDAAVQDAETMVKYAPTISQGYLCLGKILTMQGKQTAALKIYGSGLENVPTEDPAFEQLLQAKKKADEKNNRRFDLLSALPLEVKDEVVSLLFEDERLELFDVSTIWSRWLQNCQKAWRDMHNDHAYEEDVAISQVLPKIIKHIGHLTITTTMKEVWLKYLEHLEEGHFTNLKSLELTGNMVAGVFCSNSAMSLMDGFWKTRYTLTKFVFTCGYYGRQVTITNILFYLPYLETLVLDVSESLAGMLGDLESLQDSHRSLVDLTLNTSSNSGDALKPLARWCPYVRRLRLEYATPSAIDVVNDCFPNVEMLGYNTGYELPPSHEVLNPTYNNNKPITPIIDANNMYIKEEQGRLRAFYSSSYLEGVPGDEFLRLLKKNQKTLEILHANMNMTRQQRMNDEPYDNFRPDYARKAESIMLNLNRLEKIMFWPDIYGVYEALFSRMVMPSLKYFESVKTSDLSGIVNTLINTQQPFETLKFSEIYIEDEEERDVVLAAQCLVRLFNQYAATSLPRSATRKNLTNIMFDSCSFISDDVLDALANIKTIKGVGFKGVNRITYQGFKNFFIKLKNQNIRITTLRLAGGQDVPDSPAFLDIIRTTENLEALYLHDMWGLTCDDLKTMIDSAKKLDTLFVQACDNIDSKDIITFVNNRNRKFKHIEIVEFDNDHLYRPRVKFDAFS